ncbi:MFS transporter [soil metagenome]
MFRNNSDIGDGNDAYAALRFRDFRLLVAASFLVSFAQAVLSVIVGWEIYERTDSALALGLVGLVQIVPNVALAIPAGQYVDRHDRKRIAVAATGLVALSAVALAILTAVEGPLVLTYLALFIIGIGRVFKSPTMGALLAGTVPDHGYTNASAWSGSASQTASIVGPAVGGLGVAVLSDAAWVFAIAAAMLVAAAMLYGRMNPRKIEFTEEKVTRDSLLAGVRFIRSTKVIFAAITLDMVAVMLGGATALLPIFAEDVLHVGATGLGLMRAAPALGAVLMSLAIAHKGPFRNAGPTLLATVACFGLATVLFGISRSLTLSLFALFLVGAFDAISMVIRDAMELTYTPDHMRGRVSSIHFIFIGMSNEFGEFESGVAAAIFGATSAVVIGGVGTLLVVPAIALIWPEMRRLRQIVKPESFETTPAELEPVGIGTRAE